MDAGAVIVIVVVLLIAAGIAGHLIAHRIWPIRRRIWRQRVDLVENEAKLLGLEHELERPETPEEESALEGGQEEPAVTATDVYDAQAAELEAQARRERLEARRAEAEARRLRQTAAGVPPPQEPERSTPRRRRAGISPEDMDY